MNSSAKSVCLLCLVCLLGLALFVSHASAGQGVNEFLQVGRYVSEVQRGFVETSELSLSLSTGDDLVFSAPVDGTRQATLPRMDLPEQESPGFPQVEEAPSAITQPTTPIDQPALMPPTLGLTPGGEPGQGPVNPLLVPPATPGTPPPVIGESLMVWKNFDMVSSFGFSQFITGSIDYPVTWLINLDSFNKMVSFAEDQSGLVMLTLFPSVIGDFTSAQEVVNNLYQLLGYNVTNLKIVSQDFRSDPQASQVGMNRTKGRVILEGNYQGLPMTFAIYGYAIFAGGSSMGLGQAILCQAPSAMYQAKNQEVFNRMIATYEISMGHDLF